MIIRFVLFFVFMNIFSPLARSDSLSIDVSENNKISVTYLFNEAQEKIDFLNKNGNARLKSLNVLTACINFDGVSITKKIGCDNFSKVEVEVLNNSYFENRQYPLSIDFFDESKSAINLTYFLLSRPIDSIVINTGGDSKNYIYFKDKFYKRTLKIKEDNISKDSEYVYFGDKISSKRKLIMGIDDALPKWIGNIIESESVKIINLYDKNLSNKFRKKSMIMASYYPQSNNNFWWGDVDKNGTISLRFYGNKWSEYNSGAYRDVLMFIAHETFHLFNSSQYTSLDMASKPWLHEGAADAAAAIGLMNLGLLDRTEFLDIFSAKFNSCNKFHAFKTGDQTADNQILRKMYYDCGFLVNFSYKKNGIDYSAANKASEIIDYDSFFSHWKSIFNKSNNTHLYNSDTFFESLDYKHSVTREDYEALVKDEITEFNPVISLLKKLNVSYENSFTYEDKIDLGKAIVSSILIKNCPNNYGFWLDNKTITIEYNSMCKGFNKNMIVEKINGYNIFHDVVSLYENLINSCSDIVLTNSINTDFANLDCPNHFPEKSKFESIIIQ